MAILKIKEKLNYQSHFFYLDLLDIEIIVTLEIFKTKSL